MTGYITSIITISVVGGIVISLVSENSQLKRYLNLILSLISLIAILSPIFSFLANKQSLEENLENFTEHYFNQDSLDNVNQLIVNKGVESIEKGIQATLIDRFKFKDTNVFVKAIVNDENIEKITIKRLEITLCNEASWTDSEAIKEYLYNLTGIEIKILKR